MIQRFVNIWAALALVGALALAIFGLRIWSRGFDSRAQPSDLEANIAMTVHDSSVPGRYEKMTNPLAAHGVDLIAAGGQYEEHCAACHGDTGDGQPRFNGLMYPRPSELRSGDAQEMSDGELYFVIKKGIRWSGMPAFGPPGDDDRSAWQMVAYLRHLPKLTPAELHQVLQQPQAEQAPAGGPR